MGRGEKVTFSSASQSSGMVSAVEERMIEKTLSLLRSLYVNEKTKFINRYRVDNTKKEERDERGENRRVRLTFPGYRKLTTLFPGSCQKSSEMREGKGERRERRRERVIYLPENCRLSSEIAVGKKLRRNIVGRIDI